MEETPYNLKTSEVNFYGYMPARGKLEISRYCDRIRIQIIASHGGFLATIPNEYKITAEFGDYDFLHYAKQVEVKLERRRNARGT